MCQKDLRRSISGPNEAQQETGLMEGCDYEKNIRKGRSGLCSFPGVFGSFRFEDNISAVGGVLFRQKRDKKGPEESGGPVWERHEKATAPGSRKG